MYYSGKTKVLGILGCPVAHSLSPAMQNAALKAAGLNFLYVPLPTAPENLAAAVMGLRAMNFRGFNVTIPHKTSIMTLLDKIDDSAKSIGAVNTVVNDNGQLIGYNTDADGFMQALLKTGFSPNNKSAVVLGAGGAAKAVVHSLRREGMQVTIGARNADKAANLAEHFGNATGSNRTQIAGYNWQTAEFTAALKTAALVVNTTPLGMEPQIDAMPPVDLHNLSQHAIIYDVIYTPSETRLLKEAAALGHVTLNGEAMLVGQGATAFRLWTGIEPDRELMTKVLRHELSR